MRSGAAVARYVGQLRRALECLRPQLVHTNGFKMHVLGVWARTATAPVVWHVHDYVSLRPVMTRLLRRYSRYCAAAVTNSRSVAEDVQAICGAGLKVYSVYNGVDLDRFSPTGDALDLDSLSGLGQAATGVVRVGLLGTLGRWKGHAVFLKALSLLPADARVRGYVIGGALYRTDGSQYTLEGLRQMAAELGISGRVGFTGFVEEPASAMRALDVVVHASTEPEPFGLVIVEAMACGRAVIASLAGGAAEIVDVGVNALGHQPGDAESLAGCIKRLAADGELRASLGRAGRARAEKSFDRARLANDLIPIYDRLASAN